jgi:predicted DCC family thiol-disulfide oxidoreductase YuxK
MVGKEGKKKSLRSLFEPTMIPTATETTAARRRPPLLGAPSSSSSAPPSRAIVVVVIVVLAAASASAAMIRTPAFAFSSTSSSSFAQSSSGGPRRTTSAEGGRARRTRRSPAPAPLGATTAPPSAAGGGVVGAPTLPGLAKILSRAMSRLPLRSSESKDDGARTSFSIPSIFSPADSRPVVLFDGKCNLCNAGVQLVLDNDRASSDPRGNLRVAAMQSRVGRVLLARLPPRQREAVLGSGGVGEGYKSIVVAGPDRAWVNSDACLRIGRELRGPLRYLSLLAWIVPGFLRDAAYRLMSRYRGRLFGTSAECRLWDDNWDTRFVDDANFGGRGSADDPFADPSSAAAASSADDDDDDGAGAGAPPGTPPVRAGDRVRVVSSRPILHTHVAGHERAGLCSVGLVGTVTRVLEGRAYPKNVAVRFEFPEDEGVAEGANPPHSFEAHFFPGQLRKE